MRERLDQDQPPRVVAEHRQVRIVTSLLTPLDRAPRRPWSTPQLSCTALPGEFSGSHTTRSGMSVITSGRVIAPRSVRDA